MSLKELTLHVVQSGDLFVRSMKLGVLDKSSKEQMEIQAAEQLKKVLQELTVNTKSNLESLKDEQFDNLVDLTDLFGKHLPGHVLFNMMREHEIYHKGQLFTYVRMIGYENLPMFVKQ